MLNGEYHDQQLDVQLERLESAVVDHLTRASHSFSVRDRSMMGLVLWERQGERATALIQAQQWSLFVCLFARPSVCPSACMHACRIVCLSVYPSVFLSAYLSFFLFVYLSVCLPIRLAVRLRERERERDAPQPPSTPAVCSLCSLFMQLMAALAHPPYLQAASAQRDGFPDQQPQPRSRHPQRGNSAAGGRG